MRHENQQIGNLLLAVKSYSLSDLDLHHSPKSFGNNKEELLNFIKRILPRAQLAKTLKVGMVFQIKELRLLGFNALIMVGTRHTGNVVLIVDQKVFDSELANYNRYPMKIDLIRSIRFSEAHTQETQGRLGEIYRRYREAVRISIDDERFEDLNDISFVSMIHDFTLTGKIPDLSNTIG
jgi:hypothetical protein